MAEKEFHDFTIKMYEELNLIESQTISGKPSIGLFCRLDIGVLVDSSGEVHYFVNKVEWTQTTSL